MKNTRPNTALRLLLAAALLAPVFAHAQSRRGNRNGNGNTPSATPAPFRAPVPAPVTPNVTLPELDPAPAQKELTPIRAEITPAAPEAKPVPAPAKGTIMLNFQGASLTDVLNYLSEAAGFVIVQEAPVSGTVNVVSRQPITAEDAVDLVNSVLIEKGYVAIRNGRILKIVKRDGAQKRDLPVHNGSDPELIPRKDEMVTQILPLRFGEAAKLVENLRPLLADNATISANDSSNSILLTDTQTNIRRIAEIIKAIDTSVASISTLHVYPLKYANAKALATVITELFASNTAGGNGGGGRGRGGNGGGGFGGGFPGFGGPGGPGGGQPASPQSEARQANSRVIAVADDQSNSLIVSAPEEVIPNITEVVNKIDTNINDVTVTRIFKLQRADAVETAEILTTLYGESSLTSQNSQNNQRGQGRQGGGFGGFNPFGPQQQSTGANQSDRALLQSKVVAVGDGRTNSLIVSAAPDTMTQIAETVGRLDASDAKKQHVYIHSLQHADADSVADVLKGMLGQQTSTNGSQSGSSRLNQRSTTGATIDTTGATSNLSGGSGGGSRTGR